MSTAADNLRDAAKLFDERQAVYGDNHKRLSEVMVALFPEGAALASAQDHARYAILCLMVVKLTRYAVNWRKGGHSDSLKDLSVYAAMLDVMDAKEVNDTLDALFKAKDDTARAAFAGIPSVLR